MVPSIPIGPIDMDDLAPITPSGMSEARRDGPDYLVWILAPIMIILLILFVIVALLYKKKQKEKKEKEQEQEPRPVPIA